jgi:hypothetical protein
MMNTQRVTTGASWRLGFWGEPPHSRASASVCQDGPKPASARGTSPKFRVYLASKRPLSIFSIVPALGAFTVPGPGTFEMSTGALVAAGIVFVVLLAIILRRGRANAELAERNGELASAFKRLEQKGRESEAALKQQIEQLKHQIASLLEVPSQDALRNAGAKVRLLVPPDGTEVFLPLLDPSCVYRITIHGTCKFSESTGWFSSREAFADALYETDKVGNFTVSHDRLKLDGVPIRGFLKNVPREAAPEEDRQAHCYAFRVDGATRKISASFNLLSEPTTQRLTLTLEVLPVGTPSPNTARSKEEAIREQAKEAERASRENDRQFRESAKHAAAYERELEFLRSEAHRESHFMDPVFQKDYAKREREKILGTLKKEWKGHYGRVMHDPYLKKLAEEKAPEVIQLIEARVNIVQLAERLPVAPPSMAENEKPKKKLKAEEVRQLIIRRQAIQADDKIARAKLKGEKIFKAKTEMDALPLDDDEKEFLKGELVRGILEEEEENRHGKNGDTL